MAGWVNMNVRSNVVTSTAVYTQASLWRRRHYDQGLAKEHSLEGQSANRILLIGYVCALSEISGRKEG